MSVFCQYGYNHSLVVCPVCPKRFAPVPVRMLAQLLGASRMVEVVK